MIDLLLLVVVSMTAGFMDSIVGGGGLIMLPGLFAILPNAPPVMLFGTNKAASIWGTSASMWAYSRRVQLPWAVLWPCLLLAFVGGLTGAWMLTQVSPNQVRRLLPWVLLAVLIYVLAKKQLGSQHQPRFQGTALRWRAALVGLLIGMYDGFFGPGTGSFLIFVWVRWFGYDFLHASANAKVFNVVTNLAALCLFVSQGHIIWHYAIVLAVANIAGSVLGTHVALRKGSGFVRIMFIIIVSLLILKTIYDSYLKPTL